MGSGSGSEPEAIADELTLTHYGHSVVMIDGRSFKNRPVRQEWGLSVIVGRLDPEVAAQLVTIGGGRSSQVLAPGIRPLGGSALLVSR